MSFVPLFQAKTPKYNIYGNNGEENWAADDPGISVSYGSLNVFGLTGATDDDISIPSENVPVHSTPFSTRVPPLLARVASTVATDSSLDTRQTRNTTAAGAGRGGGESSTESISSMEVARNKDGLSKDVTGMRNLSLLSKTSESWASSSRRGARSYRQPPDPFISTSTTTLSSATTSKVRTSASSSSNRTPASNRMRTPGSGPSKTSGSGRSKTPGSGRTRTPGSAASRTPRSAQELPPSAIVAVVEGRGQARREVGVAAIDLRCPQLSLAQFSDTHTYTRTITKLSILNPLEIIVATTAVRLECERGSGGGGLVKVVQESIPGVSVTAVHRRYFNDTRGLAIVKHLAAPHCAYVERHVATKYYCLASVAAVMKYVEHIQHVTYAPHSLLVSLTSSENSMSIGIKIATSETFMEFAQDTEQRCELRLNYVISMKNTLELVDPLAKALHDVTDPLLLTIKEGVSSTVLEELLGVLREVVHEDARMVKGAAAMRTQRCYAIKSHVNGLLDVARKIYSEIIDDITEHVETAGREHGVYVRVGHNAARGFHITIPVKKKTQPPRLDSVFIQIQRGRGCITCTTEHLYQLDQRSRDTLREILIMSNVIVLEMLVEARGRMGALHGLGEAVATLDLLVALAHAAALGTWVRPEFSHALAIRNGRHPILDVLAIKPPVPNNTFLSPENSVMVVTGPNMSGKSTYLRQIALIQVLAQIGSFVPAEYASLRLVRQIYTHLGSEDAPENNASTFQVQDFENLFEVGRDLLDQETG
ncbi:mutS protein homolog 4-like [Homarus americanus]|uniref:mutS protein homolog 4-like n=1 Tax=Homarus americanus TaxID=6706 RepID=UPI001C4828C3|nr:mutS protein homolog 4-like [Homarus americanus]